MTTTPLPPLPDHVGRVTPSGVFTFVGLSLMGGGKVYTNAQMQAYANQARADLEAENARLREALQVLVDNGGIGPEWMFDDARAALEGTK